MRWVDAIVQSVRPAFGGIPTFCVDHDHLLDKPELREALRAAGMSIHDWDMQEASLARFQHLSDDDRPLVVVPDTGKRHVVESCIANHAWVTIGIADLMPKFPRELVLSVPTTKWDVLMAIHDGVRSPRSLHDAALLIGRSLYGIDPEYLVHGDGWLHVLCRIALDGEGVPDDIATAVCDVVAPPNWLTVESALASLCDPAAARQVVLTYVSERPEALETAQRSVQVMISEMRRPRAAEHTDGRHEDIRDDWERSCDSPAAVLRFAIRYGEARSAGAVSDEDWDYIDGRFTEWVQKTYGIMLNSPNPEVLRTVRLLDDLDSEVGSDRLMLVVIDALSLQAWPQIRDRWISHGAIGRAETRAAFAVLPTITSFGRRALFEGRQPSQFGREPHSQRLERRLWSERYGGSGEYLEAGEESGIREAIMRGRERVCVVDVTWDKRGHAVDPSVDSIIDAARVWAAKSRCGAHVHTALNAGYRVFVTSDHGQVECRGIGRLDVGTIPEEKCKRVIWFNNPEVSASYAREGTLSYRPTGLPKGVCPLFALGRASFDILGAQAVSHGGLSLDELIVPVVEVFA